MNRYIWHYIILFSLYVLFLLINNSIPIISDDFLYGYIFPKQAETNNSWGINLDRPIADFSDILVSQYNHFFCHGGRIPVHILVQLFSGLLGKTIFSYISSFFFIFFILLLGKNCFGKDTSKDILVIYAPFLVFFLLIIQPKCFYSTIATGINYLWTSVVCLAFLYIHNKEHITSKLYILIYWLLAILAGWSHEGIVIPLGIALFLHHIKEWRDIPKYKTIATFLFFIGALFLVMAPGNFVRKGAGLSIVNLFLFLYSLRIFYLYIFLLAIFMIRHGKKFVNSFFHENIYLNYGIIASLSIFGIFNDGAIRVGYGIDLLSCILIGRLLSSKYCIYKYKKVTPFLASFTILLFFAIYYYQNIASKQFYEIQIIAKNSTNNKIVIDFGQSYSFPHFLNPFIRSCSTDESKEWIIQVEEMKYNKSIIIKKTER